MASIAAEMLGQSQTPNFGMVIVEGSFAPNGSSALDATKVKGRGFTVAYTTTGVYTVTLAGTALSLVSCSLQLQMATAADSQLQLGAVDTTTAGTIVINNLTAGSLADIAANAGNRIHFRFALSTSTLTK